jgi:N-methylhydantoinase A
MEVRVAAPAGDVNATTFLSRLVHAFNATHLRTFGYNYAGQQKVELVNFAVSGFGLIERPSMPKLSVGGGKLSSKGQRPVYFGGGFQDTPIYDRAALPPGFTLEGPAVVEEFGSTTVVFPGQNLEVDSYGILIIRASNQTTVAP